MTDRWSTPERLALRKLAKDVVSKEIAPNVAQWEREGMLPRSLHKTFAEAGLLGVSFPTAVGGGGGDAIDSAILAEEVMLGGGSGGIIASLFSLRTSIVSGGILCVLGTGLLTLALPAFRLYDGRTGLARKRAEEAARAAEVSAST